MDIIDKLKWEIGVTLRHYANSKDKNKDELYAKAILINCKIGYGLVYVIDDFIECVEDGFYIDYDGIARCIDENGDYICGAKCDTKYLKNLKRKGIKYIAWFNK